MSLAGIATAMRLAGECGCMALKPAYDSVDAIPEPLREHYAPAEDGKFRPSIEDAKDGWAFHDARKLTSAANAARTERDEAKRLAKAFEGLEPERAREAVSKYDEMKSWTPEQKVREQIEAREKGVTEKFTKELQKAQDREQRMTRALSKALVEGRAAAAIAKFKGIPGAVEALMPHIQKRAKVVELESGDFAEQILDEAGNRAMTMRSGKSGDMDMEELVESFREHEVFGRFFEGSGAAGSGTQGAGRHTAGGKGFTISRSEARNPAVYLARKTEAEKAGATLVYVD